MKIPQYTKHQEHFELQGKPGATRVTKNKIRVCVAGETGTGDRPSSVGNLRASESVFL